MFRDRLYDIDRIGHHMSPGGGLLLMIGVAILVGLLVYLIVTLTKNRQSNQMSANNTAQLDSISALSILNDRYARGEIDDEEYKRRKTELKS